MPARLKHGVQGASGGAREGAGRPTDWLRQKCREIIDKKAVLEFLGGVVAGENFEQVVNSDGEVIALPPPLKDRLKASELLLDRGYGKPGQSVEVTGADGEPLQSLGAQDVVAILRAFEGGDSPEAKGGAGKAEGK